MSHTQNEGKRSDPPERSASEPRRGGEAALRLEKRTHLNSGKYKVILRNYGDGMAEIGWSFVGSANPFKAGKGQSEKREDHESRAQRRARSRIRQLILSANADHMLTLTYRENVTDFRRACADLSKFVRLVKRKLPQWVYIAVSEQQQRGAWHWHLAVIGRQDVELLRTAWRRVVVEGNIDVSPPKGAGTQRRLSLVRYLGKYLAKGFTEGNRKLNERRFRASLGIVVPEVMLTLPKMRRHDAAGYAVQSLAEAAGSIGYVWQSEQNNAGWACSWK